MALEGRVLFNQGAPDVGLGNRHYQQQFSAHSLYCTFPGISHSISMRGPQLNLQRDPR